jgi:hypothetical protein
MIIRNYVIGHYHVIADNHLLSKICHLSICQTVRGGILRGLKARHLTGQSVRAVIFADIR